MVRRPLRPSFSFDDKNRLIEALGSTRDQVLKCGSAERFGSDLHQLCGAVKDTIDRLAEGLTGRRNAFVSNMPPQLSASPELDNAATAIFNAVHATPGFKPITRPDDLESEGEENAVRDWRTIRHAIEKMPADVLAFLSSRQPAKPAHE